MEYLIQDSRKLSDTLFNLRERFSSLDILANPYFQLVKPTPENLKKYSRITNNDKVQFSLTLISFLPSLLQNFTVNLAHCFLYSSESRRLKREKITNSEWLLISHFTEAAYQNQHDLFLHTLPEDLNSRKLSNSTFLLNHTKRKYGEIYSWLQQNKQNPTILNPRSVSVFVFLKIFFTQTKLALRIFWAALNDKNIKSIERTLMIVGAKHQTHRETLVNIMLGKNLKILSRELDPRNIVFTFEGHAFELYLRKILSDEKIARRFYFFQHAPIVPAQFGMIQMCSLMHANDQVLASGDYTKDFLQNKLSEKSRAVLILGSPKHVSSSSPVLTGGSQSASKHQVLLAPEGTRDSLFEFSDLGKYLAQQLPDEKFQIRVHPAVKLTSKDLYNFTLHKFPNLHISNRTLLSDLTDSKVCIYRSSAVGIEASSLGVIPIHLGYMSKSDLNPLHLCDSRSIGFITFEEIYNFIQDGIYSVDKEARASFRELNSSNGNYYAEFNSKILFG